MATDVKYQADNARQAIAGLERTLTALEGRVAVDDDTIDKLITERDDAVARADANAKDASELAELRALVAEPLTPQRMWDLYTREGSGLLGMRHVAIAIFAAQREERAVEMGERARRDDWRSGLVANQRAAVEGLGESATGIERSETCPDCAKPVCSHQRSKAHDWFSAMRALHVALGEGDNTGPNSVVHAAALATAGRLTAERDAERSRADAAEADARKWRSATDGVGDVERYARILWEAMHPRDPWENLYEVQRDACRTEARVIIAAFRARALSEGARRAMNDPSESVRDDVRAALDFACAEVGPTVAGPAFVPVDVSGLEKDVRDCNFTARATADLRIAVLALADRVNAMGARGGASKVGAG